MVRFLRQEHLRPACFFLAAGVSLAVLGALGGWRLGARDADERSSIGPHHHLRSGRFSIRYDFSLGEGTLRLDAHPSPDCWCVLTELCSGDAVVEGQHCNRGAQLGFDMQHRGELDLGMTTGELSSFVDVTERSELAELSAPPFADLIFVGSDLHRSSRGRSFSGSETLITMPEPSAGMKALQARKGHVYAARLANVCRGGGGVPAGGEARFVFEVLDVRPGQWVSLRWKLFRDAEP